MRLIALADLAVAITKAGTIHAAHPLPHLTTQHHNPPLFSSLTPNSHPTGGIGFIGAGTDVSDLASHLDEASSQLETAGLHTLNGTLPVGVGFINWGADLAAALPVIARFRPAAVWFFAPASLASLVEWTREVRRASPETKVWVQVGGVQEAEEVVREAGPDVLVVQGTDAGGHGRARGAGLVSLLPEVCDAVDAMVQDESERPVIVAAGGVVEARGVCAALALGASGAVMGTRFLAANEAVIAKGYQMEVLRARDGGQTTVRTKVWDNARGTTGWAETHNGRGIINMTYTDAMSGMTDDENKKLYEADMQKGDEGWGRHARLCTYAGSGVGLIKEVKGAGEIVREVREGARKTMEGILSVT